MRMDRHPIESTPGLYFSLLEDNHVHIVHSDQSPPPPIFFSTEGSWYEYMTELLQLDASHPRVPVSLPSQLCEVVTPLRWQEWDQRLSNYPDQRLQSYIVE